MSLGRQRFATLRRVMARPPSTAARQSMVQTAAEILRTQGVAACTVEEVSRQSGVAKTTLYRHFGSIQGLILAVVDATVKKAKVPDTGTLRGDLVEIQRTYLRTSRVRTSRELFVWMLTQSMIDPDFAVRFRHVRVQPTGPTVIVLQRAIARGEVSPSIDMDLALHVIQGPFISKRIIDNSDVDEREFNSLIDVVVAAVTAL